MCISCNAIIIYEPCYTSTNMACLVKMPYFYLLRDLKCIHLRFCGLINFAHY